MISRRDLLIALGGLGFAPAFADTPLATREWTVEGVTRQALLAVPDASKTTASSLVFVFHGHGGNSRQAANSFGIHKIWPEAVVVYPQGLPTPGQLTDPQGNRPGWQPRVGGQGDRDLKFFDAILTSLRQDYKVDPHRVYCTGHSNGGGFTYLLWAQRGSAFAAVAPSSAVDARSLPVLKPKPVLHVAGQNDPLVRFAWQQRVIEAVRKLNGCGEGMPWAEHCTLYPSKGGTPVVTLIHPGGHAFSPETPALIVRFFKENPARG
jgi:polyhydroxybutyrate depolymerase